MSKHKENENSSTNKKNSKINHNKNVSISEKKDNYSIFNSPIKNYNKEDRKKSNVEYKKFSEQKKSVIITNHESKAIINHIRNFQKSNVMTQEEIDSKIREVYKGQNTETMKFIQKKILEEQEKDLLIDNELKIFSNIRKSEMGFVDEKTLHENYLKYKIEDCLGLILLALSYFSCIMYYETRPPLKTSAYTDPNFYKYPLIVNTILVIFLCINVTLKYYYLLELGKSDKEVSTTANLFSKKDYYLPLVKELIFLIISPHIFFDNIQIVCSSNWNNIDNVYQLNDFLLIFSLLRIYIIFVFILTTTIYYNYRAFRIANMMGMTMSHYFGLKCLLYKYPFRSILVIIVSFVLIISYMLRIIEKSDKDYNKYGNCIWFYLITMTTVGYGDKVPNSNLGRIFTFVAAVFGSILLSIFISSSQKALAMTDKEEIVYKFSNRLEDRKNIDLLSCKYFKITMEFISAKNNLFYFLRDNIIDLKYSNSHDNEDNQSLLENGNKTNLTNLGIINNHEENSKQKILENQKELLKRKKIYYDKIYERIEAKKEFKKMIQ